MTEEQEWYLFILLGGYLLSRIMEIVRDLWNGR